MSFHHSLICLKLSSSCLVSSSCFACLLFLALSPLLHLWGLNPRFDFFFFFFWAFLVLEGSCPFLFSALDVDNAGDALRWLIRVDRPAPGRDVGLMGIG